MNVAGARRMATHLHRGQLDRSGGGYLGHLDRVAALVRLGDGDADQQMAAYLHGCPGVGLRPRDLAARGVPARVVQLVTAVTGRATESAEARRRRVVAFPGAALVRAADLADTCRRAAIESLTPADRRQLLQEYRELRERLGAPDLPVLTYPDPDLPDSAGLPADLDVLIAEYLDIPTADVGRRTALYRKIVAALRGDGSPDPQRLDRLRALADHPDGGVRVIALDALADHPAAMPEPLLRRALAEPDPRAVQAAVRGLGPLPARWAVDALLPVLDRDEAGWHHAQRAAAVWLARTDDPRAALAIWRLVAGPNAVLARVAARHLLRDADRATAVPWLRQELRMGVRHPEAVALALARYGAREAAPDIVAALRELPAGRDQAIAGCAEALGRLAVPDSGEALLARAGHASPTVRRTVLAALYRVGGPCAEAAAQAAAEDPLPDVRAMAARMLGRWGGAGAVPRLIALCDGRHVQAALRGLARLADPRAVPTLQDVVNTAPDRATRHLAGRALARCAKTTRVRFQPAHARAARVLMWVLGHSNEPSAVHPLVEGLRAPDELVRARAAAALGRLGMPGAVDGLIAALGDGSPRVRATAVTALGRLGDRRCRDRISECLTADPHPDVRNAAAAALRRL